MNIRKVAHKKSFSMFPPERGYHPIMFRYMEWKKEQLKQLIVNMSNFWKDDKDSIRDKFPKGINIECFYKEEVIFGEEYVQKHCFNIPIYFTWLKVSYDNITR